jgi:hypothetical protein
MPNSIDGPSTVSTSNVEVNMSSHNIFSTFSHLRNEIASSGAGEVMHAALVELSFASHCAVRSRPDMTDEGTVQLETIDMLQPPRRNIPVREETP